MRSVTPNEGGARFVFEAEVVLDDIELGASIAVNGCCLTVVAHDDDHVVGRRGDRDARAHQPRRPRRRRRREPRTPGAPRRPARRPPRAGSRRRDRHRRERANRSPTARSSITIAAPADVLRYVVHKGSITVDGVSLTVAASRRRRVRRSRSSRTRSRSRRSAPAAPGTRVNLEVDLIAKYVEAVDCSPEREHTMTFDEVERAIDAVQRGEFVVVVDDEDRENEGDLIIAADQMTPDKMAFMIRYTSGVICLPMEGRRLDELQLPLMVVGRRQHRGPAHRVHGLGRRQGRHDHRDLGRRPQHDRARADRRRDRRGATSPGPATSSRCATARAAC